MSVDGVVAWAKSFTGTAAPAPLCGQQGVNDAYEEIFFTVSHYADFVTVRVSTTLDSPASDEAFGIDDIRLIPIRTGVDQPGYFESFETVRPNSIRLCQALSPFPFDSSH